MTADIAENFDTIYKSVAQAAKACGRDAKDVHVLAACKRQPVEKIRAALDHGHMLFGENRVQEAQAHWPELKKDFPDVELHMIGHLQTNKAADAVALFDVIETLDRPKLARIIAKEAQAQNRAVKCFIQVNTGEEEQKGGVSPGELDAFAALCRDELGLDICGLMCIPPVDEPPELHFALLADMAKNLGLPGLSMGMSGDFETAIRFGATHIRIGTALFGPRAS